MSDEGSARPADDVRPADGASAAGDGNAAGDAHASDDRMLEAVVRQARVLATGLPGALGRISVSAGPLQVDIEWQTPGTIAAPAAQAVVPQPSGGALPATGAVPAAEPEPEPTGHAVTAPLVGTFYLSPEPGAPPFVSEGDVVEAGAQVAIVEAMKIMNAVDADRSGRVTKILVSDGDMVDYGQELMIIEPDDLDG
jgi:acetyl-CoA carboxylase biotin carboxyl carrier protein